MQTGKICAHEMCYIVLFSQIYCVIVVDEIIDVLLKRCGCSCKTRPECVMYIAVFAIMPKMVSSHGIQYGIFNPFPDDLSVSIVHFAYGARIVE